MIVVLIMAGGPAAAVIVWNAYRDTKPDLAPQAARRTQQLAAVTLCLANRRGRASPSPPPTASALRGIRPSATQPVLAGTFACKGAAGTESSNVRTDGAAPDGGGGGALGTQSLPFHLQ